MNPQFTTPHWLAGLALAMGLASPALAVQYTQFQPAESQVEFTYSQMGVALHGSFNELRGEMSFDPAQPTAAQARFEIPVASVDIGMPEINEEVGKPEWFAASEHPLAIFELHNLEATGNDQYQASGTLDIKGTTQEIEVPVSFTGDATRGMLNGEFTLHRGDFAIGEGDWASDSVVAHEVNVRFQLVATP